MSTVNISLKNLNLSHIQIAGIFRFDSLKKHLVSDNNNAYNLHFHAFQAEETLNESASEMCE